MDDNSQNIDESLKIVFLGDSGVGKTTILSKYMTNNVDQFTQPTIGSMFFCKKLQRNNKNYELQVGKDYPDLGHGWTGEVQGHRSAVLPRCQRRHTGLRRHQSELLRGTQRLDQTPARPRTEKTG